MSCTFCDSEFADPILPHNRQKICVLFNVSFNGKKLLHDGKICTRCHVQVELIDNAMRLKGEMNQCLQEKLGRNGESPVTNANALGPGALQKQPPLLTAKMENVVPSPQMPLSSKAIGHHTPSNAPPLPPPLLTSPPTSAAAEMMAMVSLQSSLAALASAPMLSMPHPMGVPGFNPASLANGQKEALFMTNGLKEGLSMPKEAKEGGYMSNVTPEGSFMPNITKDGVFMCVHCGKAFKDHSELIKHDSLCASSRSNGDLSPMGCDRCGQSLKYRCPEDRIKHIVQCKGQGLRRGRPSTGIVNCPKCNLSLKNRMNHDRINHVQRCNGSGLKRGRPSLKSVDKFQCEKCSRNLWSRDQLELHASKCDGSHIERRGRKPGDNLCMVCGENLIYRHILKKHLRQAHGINPQNLDDSVIAAVKNEHSVDELSTPYKRILLNQIQQQLTTPLLPEDMPPGLLPQPDEQPGSNDSLSQSFDSALSHRKKAVPCKYVATEGELNYCNKCDKGFESKESLEQHDCTVAALTQPLPDELVDSNDSFSQSYDSALSGQKQAMPLAAYNYPTEEGEIYFCDKCDKGFEHKLDLEQHDCMSESPNAEELIDDREETEESVIEEAMEVVSGDQGDSAKDSSEDVVGEATPVDASESVDDVISAISERAEAVGSTGSIKGSAIAQVISGLLGANKIGSNSNTSSSNLTSTHRQSIST